MGPISLLCIRKTLTDGRLAGFVCGMGAATADGLYGFVAALGLTWVSDLLFEQQVWLRLVGGLFLVYLGARTFLTRSSVATGPPVTPDSTGLARSYASTFALTVANPTTILSFAAIFAGLGLGTTSGDRGSAVLMIGGVFLGSALWWLLLSGAVGFFRRALTPARLRWVNRLSGALLAGLSVVSFLSLAR